jgi:glycosyltransferase involved in cell wall biosynthesis
MGDVPLKIAIDGRELVGKPTGVGTYLAEILRAWKTSPFPHRLLVITPSPVDAHLSRELNDVVWHVEPARSAGTRWEQTRLPRALARAQPDVFFAPANTAPLRLPCPLVLTIHDVSFFAHPEWFGRREGWRRRWLTRTAARRARRVVTVSEFSRAEIQKHLQLPADRFVVAPNGSPVVVNGSSAPRSPLLLYVGSLFNRRHVPDLIKAFASVAARVPEARLVLVGDNRTFPRIDPREIAAAHGVQDRMEWREYASDGDRDKLYRSARAFAFLSDYEGFGIPPMEALAHGVPSVVLDTPVSREVYGEAALRVSPDTAAIADACVQLLTDDGLRSRLLEAGRSRLARYSWSTTATTVRRVLEEAAAR